MGIIGIAFGLGFILGPFVGGELSRFPVFGREGTLPGFVAAGLAAVNFLLALRTLPESLPPERRGKQVRRAVPLDLAALRAAVAVPGVGAAVAVNFAMVLWFAGMEQTFRAVHRRRVRHVGPPRPATSSWSSASSARSCRAASSAGSRRVSARRAWCTAGVFIQAAAFALLGLSSRFRGVGRPGAVHLGGVDRPR